ncbi:alpha/beta fold hydrolase [Streptomyces antimycoticus]|uniref:alpha/beta fold hydrolase n=1 Tax=Streptomyces antimycoticus TaxID=68175 RepID=UPI0036ACE6C9
MTAVACHPGTVRSGLDRNSALTTLRRGGSARRRRRSGAPEDVAAVRQVLRAGDEPSVVAHSYGGIVTAEAAAGVGSVRHLLLVSSYLPEAGQSLSDSADGSPAPFLEVDPDAGAFGVRPELLVTTFLQDCAPEVRRRRTTSPGRACGGPGSRSGLPQGSRCPRRTSSAPRTGAPRRGCSGSSPAGPAASSSSTPATTRSCLSLKRSGTCLLSL